jgi:hypothetical protein
LTAAAPPAWEARFAKIPRWKPLDRVRLRFQEIFDTARDRPPAARWWRPLGRETEGLGRDLSPFFETDDRGKREILTSFDARPTSAAGAGITTKARVLTQRTSGLKSADSLGTRLILDRNRASEAIGGSIEPIRQRAQGLTALFDPART